MQPVPCEFLVAMGVRIEGIGSPTIRIEGVDHTSVIAVTPPNSIETRVVKMLQRLLGESVAVRFVPGMLEMFFAVSVILSRSSRTG